MIAQRLGRALWRWLSDAGYRERIWQNGSKTTQQKLAALRPSYKADPPASSGLQRFFQDFHATVDATDSERILSLAQLHLDHRFHLLGSGWRQAEPAGPFPGVEGHRYSPQVPTGDWLDTHVNRANRAKARELWTLIELGYRPIDWRLDLKTGHRFSQDVFRLGPPGSDVKVPWELARMQHFPLFAYAYRLSGDTRYATEFRNQLLDFMATNPPGLGIHWADGLEAGIRVANVLVAWDLFLSFGATFDRAFEIALHRSVEEHAAYLAANLPWEPVGRGNHYLGALAGLLFACAYLPESADTDAWLAFAIGELQAESLYEFQPDGSHFEGATAYHLFCADILAWAVALITALPRQRVERVSALRPRLIPNHTPGPVPAAGQLRVDLFERLPRILSFLEDIRRPDGDIVQIGDADSGRFFTLGMSWRRMAWKDAVSRYASLSPGQDAPEEHWESASCAPGDVLSSLRGAIGERYQGITGDLTSHLSRLRLTAVATAVDKPFANSEPLSSIEARLMSLPQFQRLVTRIECAGGKPLTEGLSVAAYRDFGLFLFRSPRLFLAVRCSQGDGIVNRGHAHNDELSAEIWIDGVPRFVDPGTYLYSALPKRRNEYRSAHAHFAPRLADLEPRDMNFDLFRFAEPVQGRQLHFSLEGFAGEHASYGLPLCRVIRIAAEAVIVTDAALAAPPSRLVNEPEHLGFSPGYGVLERRKDAIQSR